MALKNWRCNIIVKIARRLNNEKRKHLIINTSQAKHIPVDPDELEDLVKKLTSDLHFLGNTVVIGFAETATAIGAFVAEYLEAEWYVHTTRENINQELSVTSFKEEHSHAPDQMLFSVNQDLFNNCDNIVFVDDELSSGKTLLNFIRALKDKICNIKNIYALSLVNCMKTKDLKKFDDLNIKLKYLTKLTIPVIIEIEGKSDPRISVNTNDYIQFVKNFIAETINAIELKDIKTILVLGTEEFMYPAIKLASAIKNLGFCVKTQSTTRSPIETDDCGNYPIKTRDTFKSLYDSSRDNYLYNLDKYDEVIIVTDSKDSMEIFELAAILGNYGNENIHVMRWVD